MPLACATLGGLYSEGSGALNGVLNIVLEGMLPTGAFASAKEELMPINLQ